MKQLTKLAMQYAFQENLIQGRQKGKNFQLYTMQETGQGHSRHPEMANTPLK